MDRRNFVKASVAAIAATQLGALDAVARKKQKDKAPKEEVRLSGTDWACEHSEALPGDLNVRFLGTGAAGWKSPTSGHRRNSSILINNTDTGLLYQARLAKEDEHDADGADIAHGEEEEPIVAHLMTATVGKLVVDYLTRDVPPYEKTS